MGGAPCVPEPEVEPLPMFGQLSVEPLPELELELEPFELDPDELDPDELDDGVVVEVLLLAPEPGGPGGGRRARGGGVGDDGTTGDQAGGQRAQRQQIAQSDFHGCCLSSRVVRPPVRAGTHTVRLGSVAGRRPAAA